MDFDRNLARIVGRYYWRYQAVVEDARRTSREARMDRASRDVRRVERGLERQRDMLTGHHRRRRVWGGLRLDRDP